jgi:quaternary ammonium compound-resistance protein SugE
MAWIYLPLAGLAEMTWPIGLKLGQLESRRVFGIALAVIGMAVSGFLLWLAQREIPLGTSYAVWSGIGAVGTFAVGVLYFGDATNLGR